MPDFGGGFRNDWHRGYRTGLKDGIRQATAICALGFAGVALVGLIVRAMLA